VRIFSSVINIVLFILVFGGQMHLEK